MNEISIDELNALKEFLETKPACQKAIKNLKSGVEIEIVIDQQKACAYFHKDGKPTFEFRAAMKPDVRFNVTVEAVHALVRDPGDDVGKLGVRVLELYISKQVRIVVLGNLLGMVPKGYLGIVKEGGFEFARFLAEHGVNSISKIPDIIQSLKKKT